MKPMSKGQVTIPPTIREQLGTLPSTEVQFTIGRQSVKIDPKPAAVTRGQQIVARMGGSTSVKMSTDEVKAMPVEIPVFVDSAADDPVWAGRIIPQRHRRTSCETRHSNSSIDRKIT